MADPKRINACCPGFSILGCIAIYGAMTVIAPQTPPKAASSIWRAGAVIRPFGRKVGPVAEGLVL
ncbi:MAG: hypothetical protein NWP79_03985, partial [Paracoccaceae bacterium]|nr:hypothetical protein [Paracoccaceae bacterium]